MTECPQCGGALYANAKKIAEGWKGPLFKCKDAGCGFVQWPPKGPKPQGGSYQKGGPPRHVYTWDELGKAYQKCRQIAERVWKGTPVEKDPSALVAAAATLWIAAKDCGLKVDTTTAASSPGNHPPARSLHGNEEPDY